jgi:hypothetical protein
MQASDDQREGPETERKLSRVGAITEAFKTLTLAAPNELIRAYVVERHDLEVKDDMIESLRRLVRE